MIPHIQDPQWFALSWYGQTIEAVCRAQSLRPVRDPAVADRLRGWPGVATGHVVAVSDGVGPQAPPVAVVGGPCIGDCADYPTLEALYDVVQALVTARAQAVPALLYVGDREEIAYRGGRGRWPKVAARVSRWLRAIGEWAEVETTVVRTTSQDHVDALAAAGHAARGLPATRLDGAFHLGSGDGASQDDRARAATATTIEAHLPSVVRGHLGVGAGPVAVVENLQQAGVWQLARELVTDEADRLEFVGHLPAPAASGAQRMYRAGPEEKLRAWDLDLVARGDAVGVHPYVIEFFATWLEPAERAAVADVARSAWA